LSRYFGLAPLRCRLTLSFIPLISLTDPSSTQILRTLRRSIYGQEDILLWRRLPHQHPPQVRPDCNKTPFITTDVDPTLAIVQANRPVSEAIPLRSTYKLPAILSADSRCANVAQHALSLKHLMHPSPLSFD